MADQYKFVLWPIEWRHLQVVCLYLEAFRSLASKVTISLLEKYSKIQHI